jgi:hypothetical protein
MGESETAVTMVVEEVLPSVYHIHVPSPQTLSYMFMRPQEHYESPMFKGKVFTFQQFEEWYAKAVGNGKFTYAEDWMGFNIPCEALEPFFNGQFGQLSELEHILLDVFTNKRGTKYYVIGTCDWEGSYETMIHELAHGLFYTNEAYRKAVTDAVLSLNEDERKTVEEFLKKEGGYHPDVWVDEINAYLINLKFMKEKGVDVNKLTKAQEKMFNLFINSVPNEFLQKIMAKGECAVA